MSERLLKQTSTQITQLSKRHTKGSEAQRSAGSHLDWRWFHENHQQDDTITTRVAHIIQMQALMIHRWFIDVHAAFIKQNRDGCSLHHLQACFAWPSKRDESWMWVHRRHRFCNHKGLGVSAIAYACWQGENPFLLIIRDRTRKRCFFKSFQNRWKRWSWSCIKARIWNLCGRVAEFVFVNDMHSRIQPLPPCIQRVLIQQRYW